MDKDHIIREIKRLATAHGGAAPGRMVFERETGIKGAEWYPHLWLRWGDALVAAGYHPKQLQAKTSDEVVLQKYVELIRELGHFPVAGEIRRKARTDESFPSHNVFNRFGGKQPLIDAAVVYCNSRQGFEDIVALAGQRPASLGNAARMGTRPRISTGFVYLMKSGRHYKIGRSNSVGRREWELGIKIPIPPTTIHFIETDDPGGVEAYWHRRFAEKRGEGEWFNLTAADVAAFKRWKRIT
jgi:hypothetical protein